MDMNRRQAITTLLGIIAGSGLEISNTDTIAEKLEQHFCEHPTEDTLQYAIESFRAIAAKQNQTPVMKQSFTFLADQLEHNPDGKTAGLLKELIKLHMDQPAKQTPAELAL